MYVIRVGIPTAGAVVRVGRMFDVRKNRGRIMRVVCYGRERQESPGDAAADPERVVCGPQDSGQAPGR